MRLPNPAECRSSAACGQIEHDELVALRAEVESLRAALVSNRVIATAMGLLMSRHRTDRAAALRMLSTASQRSNIKLAVVAARLVDGAEADVSRHQAGPRSPGV